MKALKTIFAFSVLLFTTVSAQWVKLNSGTNLNLTGVAVLDSNLVIVIGEKGTMLKTTDSGKSWQKIDLNIDNDLNVISNRNLFNVSNHTIAVAGDSVFAISLDSGKTWSIQKSPYNYTTLDKGFISLFASSFYSDSSLILGTNGGHIVYSTDFGNTWQDTLLFSSKIIAANFDLFAYVPPGSGTGPRVLAASTAEYIAGNILNKEWEKYNIGLYVPWQNINSGDLAYSYKFLVGDGGEFAATPLLLRKLPNDTTWTNLSQNLDFGFFPNKIKNFGFSVLILGKYGKMFKSTDNGDTWKELSTSVNISLNDVAFYNSEIGYAVGDSGTILYTSNGGVTAVEGNQTNVPGSFKLDQNFPNPFNPVTTIRYQLPRTGFVTLKVYDLLGREVTTLVNEEKSAGKYEVKFDGSNLSSGIYFYRIKAGNFIDTKKFVLLK